MGIYGVGDWKMKKRLVVFALASLMLLNGCGILPDLNDIVETIRDGAEDGDGDSATSKADDDMDNNDVNNDDSNNDDAENNDFSPVFDNDLMAKLTLVLPGMSDSYSAADLADYTLINLMHYETELAGVDCIPKVEYTAGNTPVELLYEGVSAGEEVQCNRVKTLEMELFLSGIYGKTITIPEGTGIATANEFTNIDGYLTEWGISYITAFEGCLYEITDYSALPGSNGEYSLTVSGTFYMPDDLAGYTISTL